MNNPSVCAVMLTANRHELAPKAVACFLRQTYENARLLIYDTGERPLPIEHSRVTHVYRGAFKATLGLLRNGANLNTEADILVHFDDDDYSHPNRIAEQVALLQASGAEVVGYNEMLFWRTAQRFSHGTPNAGDANVNLEHDGEAWLYSNPVSGTLGTSLCYWRKTWERHHFAHETQGVEDHWLREKKLKSVSSVLMFPGASDPLSNVIATSKDPRMIARIHGANTSNGYRLEEYIGDGSKKFPREVQWKRVPEWDAKVREILGA